MTVFAGDDLQHSLEALRRGEAVLVDVREASEWEQGHVPGALLLPLSRLQTPAEHKSIQAMLPQEKMIVAHCIKGKRSLAAVEILNRWGYQAVSLPQNAQELISAGFGGLGSRNN
jgi:rhodanese-related sulfurtransferase